MSRRNLVKALVAVGFVRPALALVSPEETHGSTWLTGNSFLFPEARLAMERGELDWRSSIVKGYLLSGRLTPGYHGFAEVRPLVMAETLIHNPRLVTGVADADDATFSAVKTGLVTCVLVVANRIPVGLLGYFFGLPVMANGGDITVAWAHRRRSGIFAL